MARGFRRYGKGRTVDRPVIDGRQAVLKLHPHTYQFTLIVEGVPFEGSNPYELRRQAEMHVKGHTKVTWEPMIVIETDIFNFEIDYWRSFKAIVNKKPVWRHWAIDGEQERTSRSHDMDRLMDTLEGEPGNVYPGPVRLSNRTVAYTPERWQALRKLDKAIQGFYTHAKDRLEEILTKMDLENDLVRMADKTPRLLLTSEEKP